MAQENVDVVRRFIDAFNRGDDDAALALTDPGIEFHTDLIEQQAFRGHAGVRDYRRNLDDAWGSWRIENNRFLGAGEDQVLQLYQLILHGRESGIPVHLDGGILWTISNAKIASGVGFLNQAEALESAGMSE